MKRTFCSMASEAFQALKGYESQLALLQRRVTEIEALLRDRDSSITGRQELRSIQDGLHFVRNEAQNIQAEGLDSIVLQDDIEGKNDIISLRRHLNREVEALLSRVEVAISAIRNNCQLSALERRLTGSLDVPPLLTEDSPSNAGSLNGPVSKLETGTDLLSPPRIQRLASGDAERVDDNELGRVVELMAASARPQLDMGEEAGEPSILSEGPITILSPSVSARVRSMQDEEISELSSYDNTNSTAPSGGQSSKPMVAEDRATSTKSIDGGAADEDVQDHHESDFMNMDHACMSSEEEAIPKTTIFYSWGRGEEGQLMATSERINFLRPHKSGRLSKYEITDTACSLLHTIALTATGEVVGAGANAEGQVDKDKAEEFICPPTLVESLLYTRITQVSCGVYHTACLTADGTVITYGGNDFGQLGHSRDSLQRVRPRVVEGPVRHGKAVSVACGELYTIILMKSGDVYGCGLGYSNVDNDSNSIATQVHKDNLVGLVKGLAGLCILKIASGNHHCLALTATGTVYSWGKNDSGQLGIKIMHPSLSPASVVDGSEKRIYFPTQIELNKKIATVACGGFHSAIIAEDNGGTLYTFGKNTKGQLGHRTASPCVPLPKVVEGLRNAEVVQVTCGQAHTVVLVRVRESQGCVWTFGCGEFGQLGNQDVTDKLLPVQVESLVNYPVRFIRAGGDHSVAVVSSWAEDKYPEPLIPIQTLARKFYRSITLDAARKAVKEASDLQDATPLLNYLQECFTWRSLNESFIPDDYNPGHCETPTHAIIVEDVELFYTSIFNSPFGAQMAEALRKQMDILISSMEVVAASLSQLEQLRALLILWQCPLNSSAGISASVFAKLCNILLALPATALKKLILCFKIGYPAHIFGSRTIGPLQKHLTYHLNRDHGAGKIIPVIGRLLYMLFLVNDQANIIPTERFYNETASSLPDQALQMDYVKWRNNPDPTKSFSFCAHPFLLNASAKRRILRFEAALQMSNEARQALSMSLFGMSLGSPFFILRVRRQFLLQDTLQQISFASQGDLKKQLKVIFQGEEGIDEGGVKKEFFQLLVHQLFDVNYGMFIYNEETRTIWFNRNSLEAESEFFLIGCILGLAIYNGVVLDVHFPVVVYRLLLKRSISLVDMKGIDPGLCKGLQQFLDYAGDDVEEVFGRTFEVVYEFFGQTVTHELIPNGSQIPVTSSNKTEYVDKYVQWYLKDSIKFQFDAFARGFLTVVGGHALDLCRAEELELLVAGSPDLDFKDLERVTTYDGGFHAAHNTIRNFWDVLKGMDITQKQKFLMFTTGCMRAPIGGLGNLPFKVHRAGPDSMQLPTAHTCFNTLLLPEYSTKDRLRERLLIAINECEGFGLM